MSSCNFIARCWYVVVVVGIMILCKLAQSFKFLYKTVVATVVMCSVRNPVCTISASGAT